MNNIINKKQIKPMLETQEDLKREEERIAIELNQEIARTTLRAWNLARSLNIHPDAKISAFREILRFFLNNNIR